MHYTKLKFTTGVTILGWIERENKLSTTIDMESRNDAKRKTELYLAVSVAQTCTHIVGPEA